MSLVGATCILAGMSYLLFDYFFSPSSPQRIYSRVLKLIRNSDECQRELGSDIAGFGEQGRRARRHIASQSYMENDEKRVRVTFHVKGERNAGRAFVETVKRPGETWQDRFIVLHLADHSRSIVLLDER